MLAPLLSNDLCCFALAHKSSHTRAKYILTHTPERRRALVLCYHCTRPSAFAPRNQYATRPHVHTHLSIFTHTHIHARVRYAGCAADVSAHTSTAFYVVYFGIKCTHICMCVHVHGCECVLLYLAYIHMYIGVAHTHALLYTHVLHHSVLSYFEQGAYMFSLYIYKYIHTYRHACICEFMCVSEHVSLFVFCCFY